MKAECTWCRGTGESKERDPILLRPLDCGLCGGTGMNDEVDDE